MIRNLTCIICPLGCPLSVELEGEKVIDIHGYTCARGKEYGKRECTSPKRTVTSTVKCIDGSMISVKTASPIPKEKMAQCMAIINEITLSKPVHIGDVIREDVFGSNIVATQNRE